MVTKKIKFLRSEGKRDRKSAGSPGMLGHGMDFGGTSRDYVLNKILKMRRMQTSSTSSPSEDHLQHKSPCTNRWLKHRCCWKKKLRKHAIKL